MLLCFINMLCNIIPEDRIFTVELFQVFKHMRNPLDDCFCLGFPVHFKQAEYDFVSFHWVPSFYTYFNLDADTGALSTFYNAAGSLFLMCCILNLCWRTSICLPCWSVLVAAPLSRYVKSLHYFETMEPLLFFSSCVSWHTFLLVFPSKHPPIRYFLCLLV